MDTKKYIPINPKYVESIDINSLIEPKPIGVNLNEMPPDNYYTTTLPFERHIDSVPYGNDSTVQPVIAEQPVERPLTFDEIPPLPFDQPVVDVPYGSVNTVPVVGSDNDILDQQQKQRKRRILDESLNEEQQQQQQQPIRRRRKPKMNETTK